VQNGTKRHFEEEFRSQNSGVRMQSVGDSDPPLNCCTTKFSIWWGCKNAVYSDATLVRPWRLPLGENSLPLRYRGLALSVLLRRSKLRAASLRVAMPKALPLVHEVSPIGEEKAIRQRYPLFRSKYPTEFWLLIPEFCVINQ
jgi:hypothetical protein